MKLPSIKPYSLVLLLSSAFILTPQRAAALGERSHISEAAAPGSFRIAAESGATTLFVDSVDYPGVARAVQSFATDVHTVTGQTPTIVHNTSSKTDLILIGTIGHSPIIDKLIAAHKIDVSSVAGHWETSVTTVVANPMPGVKSALVIAGADKRGTIFGIYDLSEQIGVSPWSWWADVAVRHKNALYLTAGKYLQPEPAVKYRGIFFNDEAPALTNYVKEKFGKYDHTFYEHVFELLLRLKANFLWPAMWDEAFAADDPLNTKLADEYGIVMSTSHEEPMMRAEKEWTRTGHGAWDYTTNQKEIDDYWRAGMLRNKDYEQVVTLGMRGINDTAMSASTNTQSLEKIVANQRQILKETVNPDLTKVPQVWALYKEVQTYYEQGMRVPDDVTLLWCDDNWGNLRRLPTPEERKRPGGAGIYYHFDYVGGPRSYKWLNTYNITKVQEQMNLAIQYGADRIWVVNVGDLKPMEFPIEFFLSMAREPQRWTKDNLQEYTTEWATREFGSEHATEIAELVTAYTKYNSRRKPEQLEPTTYSLTQDHEADRVDAAWRDLTARAERISTALPEDERASFFELVLYPLKASANVSEMYIAAGRNQLYAKQGRTSANYWADETRRLFAEDATLVNEYHSLLNGKWNHMMDQTHIGYTFWNEPPVNAMPAVQQVQPFAGAKMAVFAEGSEGPARRLPSFDSVNRQTRTIDVANQGLTPFSYTASTSAPWILLNKPSGEVSTDLRLEIQVDWSHVPVGNSAGTITLQQTGSNNDPVVINLTAIHPAAVSGFAENAGVVAIDAEHTSATTEQAGVRWQPLPGFGETLSGMEAYPVTAPSTLAGTPQSCMDYRFTVFADADRSVQAILAPTLSFVPGRGLRYSIALDDRAATTVDAWASNTNADWSLAVSDGVHKVLTPLGAVPAGPHTLHFCRVDPGVVLERLLIQSKPLNQTYLGPTESTRAPR